MGRINDLKGKRFGRLVVDSFAYVKRRAYRHCTCDCGNSIVTDSNHLNSGNTQSCGCLKRDRIIETQTRHGMRYTRIYRIRRGIASRCNNINCPAYSYYGGRGIKCIWNTFEDFIDDVYKSYLEHVNEFGEKETTIDRIDSNGDYYKGNYRRATRKEQSNNTSYNIVVLHNGRAQTIAQWAEEFNMDHGSLTRRLESSGGVMEEALKIPFRKRSKRD